MASLSNGGRAIILMSAIQSAMGRRRAEQITDALDASERAKINGLRRPCHRRRRVEASGLEPECQDSTRRLLQA